MVTPLDILEPGGTLIVVSACSEGLGLREFREAQKKIVALGSDGFLQTIIGKPLADVDGWETEMQLKPMKRGRVAFYTDRLSEASAGLPPWKTSSRSKRPSAKAWCELATELSLSSRGPYVVPYYAASV